jgi:hypothetical protein
MNIELMQSDVWLTTFAQIDLKDVIIRIKDGTLPTALSIDVKIGEGNLTYTETVEREYTLDRGLLDEVRNGDETPMDVSFDFTWVDISTRLETGAVATVEDALKNIGAAAAWVSSDSDPCRPYAVDIEVEYTPPCSPGEIETVLLEDFRYESLDHDLSAGTVSVSGRCNVTEATISRTAFT